MTARDYLMRAWRIDSRIGRRIEEGERLRARLNRGDKAGVMPSDGTDWREAEAAVASLDATIAREILTLCAAKREVNAAIEAVEDARFRQLLELRYRNYMTWEDIADEMGYETRHIYRLHREALRHVRPAAAFGDAGRDESQNAMVCHPAPGA